MNIGLCSWLASQSWLAPWPLSLRSSVLSLSHLALADLLPGPFGCEGNQIYIKYKVQSVIPPPPCEQLCNRYCCNKHQQASKTLAVTQARLERRIPKNVNFLLLAFHRVLNVAYVHVERVCCLLVLNSVTSTPQWIRQPEAAWGFTSTFFGTLTV
jgi:hypothetical protein